MPIFDTLIFDSKLFDAATPIPVPLPPPLYQKHKFLTNKKRQRLYKIILAYLLFKQKQREMYFFSDNVEKYVSLGKRKPVPATINKELTEAVNIKVEYVSKLELYLDLMKKEPDNPDKNLFCLLVILLQYEEELFCQN